MGSPKQYIAPMRDSPELSSKILAGHLQYSL